MNLLSMSPTPGMNFPLNTTYQAPAAAPQTTIPEYPASANPGQLLQGSPASNPWNAAPFTAVQADAARSVTGEEEGDGAIDYTGTAAGSAADAAGQGAKAANASAAARAAAQAADTGADVAPALSNAGKAAKVAGPVGTVVASGIQVFTTGSDIRKIQKDDSLSESQKEQKTGAAATEGAGSIAGGLGGAAAGAAIGAAGGPPGMIIGAVIGGLGGGKIGEVVGKAVGDSPVGKFVGKLFA